jgi:hypothetical protein
MTTKREKGQLQPLVQLLSVAFSSVSVFFLVYATEPANTICCCKKRANYPMANIQYLPKQSDIYLSWIPLRIQISKAAAHQFLHGLPLTSIFKDWGWTPFSTPFQTKTILVTKMWHSVCLDHMVLTWDPMLGLINDLWAPGTTFPAAALSRAQVLSFVYLFTPINDHIIRFVIPLIVCRGSSSNTSGCF